jgi:hypothetical protein
LEFVKKKSDADIQESVAAEMEWTDLFCVQKSFCTEHKIFGGEEVAHHTSYLMGYEFKFKYIFFYGTTFTIIMEWLTKSIILPIMRPWTGGREGWVSL